VTARPKVRDARDGRRPHLLRAEWGRDDEGYVAHMSFWRTADDRLVLQDIQSNADTRGRDMTSWLSTLGMPITVIEVIPQATGFWRRMLGERLVAGWEAATGWPHALERVAVPYPEVVTRDVERPAGRSNLRRRTQNGGVVQDRGKGMKRTKEQLEAIAGPAPKGYGAVIHPVDTRHPGWLDPEEIVARHLPMGLSERKAGYVTTWDHPFRLRADHPRYSGA